jgi:hypothetical protein
LRFVLHAGRAGSGLDVQTQLALTAMLSGARQILGLMARNGRIAAAQDARHAAISMSATHACDLTDADNVIALFEALFWMQVAVYVDIKINHAAMMKVPQWDEWVGQLRLMQTTLRNVTQPLRERVIACVNTQHRINDIVRVMFATRTA